MQSRAVECAAAMKRKHFMSYCAWLRYQYPQHFCTMRILKQNHYDVLGVQRDCTSLEVKEQFIRLSKEFHPDANPNSTECHKQFIAINEAYSVLSKPMLRRAYDVQLLQKERQPVMKTYGDIRTDAPRTVVFRDESLWEHRDKTEFYRNRDEPYYGVKGVKKMPNSYIAAGAVIFMMMGAIIHFFIAKTSSDYTIKQLDMRDKIASQHHIEAKQRAQRNGNQMQLALLRQRSEETHHK